MGSNVVVKDNELIETNNGLYGTPRLGMVTPIITQYARNTQAYGGELQNAEHKKLIWDLVQRFPAEQLAKLVNGTATEIAQANVTRKQFEYLRRAFLVNIEYSNLDKNVDKTQPQARMLSELWKQYDFLGYNGFFGNTGVVNNPNITDRSTVANPTLDLVIEEIYGQIAAMRSIGYNGSDLSLLTVAIDSTTQSSLGTIQGASDGSDWKKLQNEFQGVNFQLLPDYLGRGGRIETALTPLVTHHHASMPSLYNNYDSIDGLTNYNMFALETSAIELEEKGAIQSAPVTHA
ncbi:hypothetical protein NVP1166O_08 [Vibrio phage 1.166.O._10N.261.51.C7]|nr:hypothetical protein NVP1166O_08 [Vibrio phage 1.166.O._10N.261.51.C7]AUR94032.1 hypothetical protein NVP1190O_08 [Vibrio phage 1.190.O._10N.286.51.F12]